MRCPWAGAFLEKILGDHEHTCSTTPEIQLSGQSLVGSRGTLDG